MSSRGDGVPVRRGYGVLAFGHPREKRKPGLDRQFGVMVQPAPPFGMLELKRMQKRVDGEEKAFLLANLDCDVGKRVARRGKQPHVSHQFDLTRESFEHARRLERRQLLARRRRDKLR